MLRKCWEIWTFPDHNPPPSAILLGVKEPVSSEIWTVSSNSTKLFKESLVVIVIENFWFINWGEVIWLISKWSTNTAKVNTSNVLL